jgi:hypothetical protein
MKKISAILVLFAVIGCGGGNAEEKGKAIFTGVTDAVVTATSALENAKSEDEVRNGLLKFSVAISKQGLAMKTFEIRHPGTSLLTDEAFKAERQTMLDAQVKFVMVMNATMKKYPNAVPVEDAMKLLEQLSGKK